MKINDGQRARVEQMIAESKDAYKKIVFAAKKTLVSNDGDIEDAFLRGVQAMYDAAQQIRLTQLVTNKVFNIKNERDQSTQYLAEIATIAVLLTAIDEYETEKAGKVSNTVKQDKDVKY